MVYGDGMVAAEVSMVSKIICVKGAKGCRVAAMVDPFFPRRRVNHLVPFSLHYRRKGLTDFETYAVIPRGLEL